MDVFDLLDENWTNARVHNVKPNSLESESYVLKPLTPVEDQSQRVEHSLSDGSRTESRPAPEASQELRGSLSSLAGLSETTVHEIRRLRAQIDQDQVNMLRGVQERQRMYDEQLRPAEEGQQLYEEGLGPAPPLVTALMLLLIPVWLPILAIFLLPLAMTWAFIAGVSLVTAAMFNMLNRSLAIVSALGWKHRID